MRLVVFDAKQIIFACLNNTFCIFQRTYSSVGAYEAKKLLSIGVTSDLAKRCWNHRNSTADGFTKKYAVHKLVYFVLHQSASYAIARENKLKHWKRAWKIALIEKNNPLWNDLYDSL